MTYELIETEKPLIITDRKALDAFINNYDGELVIRYNKKIYERLNKKQIKLVAIFDNLSKEQVIENVEPKKLTLWGKIKELYNLCASGGKY